MVNNPEWVTVLANGTPYAGFESVSVSAAINQATRTFSLSVTERPGEFSLPPGTAVDVLASTTGFGGGDLVVRGFVNKYQPKASDTDHSISISGRGKGQDYVDSAAEHPTGHWENATLGQIARDVDKFGVGVRSTVATPRIDYAQIKPGETAFRLVERYARPFGLTPMGNADGSIDLTNASVARRHLGSLVEGQNIKEMDGELTDDGRFSHYQVIGQGRHGAGAAALAVNAVIPDLGVLRYRPRVILNETNTDQKRARSRAEHEQKRGAGQSLKANVTVQSWRDGIGQLFEPNRLIYLHAPLVLKISQDMLIEKVQFRQNGQNSTATLNLVDPRAYGGKGGGRKRGGTDGAWTRGF